MLVRVVPGNATADRAHDTVVHLMAGDRAHRSTAQTADRKSGFRSLNGQSDQDGADCEESTHSMFLCRFGLLHSMTHKGSRKVFAMQNRVPNTPIG